MNVYEIGGTWGNSIQWMDWETCLVVGWKQIKPEVGDSLRAKMESGKIGVYRFDEVSPCQDPKDMFFAKVSFVGYAPF